MSQSGLFQHRTSAFNLPRFGGAPSNTSSNSTTTPWIGQQIYLKGDPNAAGVAPTVNGAAYTPGAFGIMPAAAALYGDTTSWPSYFGGVDGITGGQVAGNTTYVPINPQQQASINAQEYMGYNGGSNALQGSNNYISSLLSGTGDHAASQPGIDQANAWGTQSMLGGQYLQGVQNSFDVGNTLSGQLAGGEFLGKTGGLFDQSNNYLSKTLDGSNLNPFTSPGFQNVVNGTLANVIPATSASFINGGRSDSGLAQAAQTAAATNAVGQLANSNYMQQQGINQQAAGLASQNENMGLTNQLGNQSLNSQTMLGQENAMQNTASQLYNNYYTGQGNQVKAAAAAPATDQQILAQLQNVYTSGGLGQSDLQNQVNAAVQNWNYTKSLPQNMLQQYANTVNGINGGSSTTQTQPFAGPSAATQAMQAATSAATIAAMIAAL